MSIFINNNPFLEASNYVEFNTSVSEYEKQQFIRILESVDPDEGFGDLLRPVFIVLVNQYNAFAKVGTVLQKVAKDRDGKSEIYWHVSLGFGPNLKHLYSFNAGNKEFDTNKGTGGLSFESIENYKKKWPTGELEVSCIFLSKENYAKLKENFNYYVRNKEKTKYSFKSLANFVFANKKEDKVRLKMCCSQFVDSVLRQSGIHISNRTNNLTSPSDLRFKPDNKKQFLVYSGKIVNYDENNVIEKVDKLANQHGNEYFEESEN